MRIRGQEEGYKSKGKISNDIPEVRTEQDLPHPTQTPQRHSPFSNRTTHVVSVYQFRTVRRFNDVSAAKSAADGPRLFAADECRKRFFAHSGGCCRLL